ncbi:MAG: NAD-dependent malic enzyme [Acidimicrobiia bacterium]
MIERDEVFRIRTRRTPGTLAKVLAAIGEQGAHIGEIETLSITRDHNVRDVTVIAPGDEAVDRIRVAIEALPDVELVEHSIDRVFAAHEGGKIAVVPTVEVETLLDMRQVYTPGVARVAQAIHADPGLADRYTWRRNTVAVISDGSRVLGLGNLGPLAALPVMEGKALFYSRLVDLNAVPIVLGTTDPDEIIETVVRISPGFGGIHLEDIASPGVYHIEQQLIERLDIPVLHDDQHGTAVVVLAAVLSAVRLLDRPIESMTFGQVGLGAAGSAIAVLAASLPFSLVSAFDPNQAAVERFDQAGGECRAPTRATADPSGFDKVVAGSDVLVLTSGVPGLLEASKVRKGQVVVALTNPEPEIAIDEALAGGAAIAADGSIVNNVLAYPGLFRGALDAGASSITTAMKRAAAEALSSLATGADLLPDALDRAVHAEVAKRVAEAAG